ncbi:MAG: hypothetical protein P8L45_03990, partial [Longimicrobiales bacterium]|nr:hypothetical protein [Longimicrobiales bacterium]
MPLLLALVVYGCEQRNVVAVTIGTVTVQPVTASLIEGEVLDFQAIVKDVEGTQLDVAEAEWVSDTPELVAVDAQGVVTALREGSGQVSASFRGVSGTASILVIPAPDLSTSVDSVLIRGAVGDTPPSTVSVDVRNVGGGTLSGITVAVEYASGEPDGWLISALSSTDAPATLTLDVDPSGLEPGRFAAELTLASPDDDSSLRLPVELSLTGVSVEESESSTVVAEAGVSDTVSVVLDSEPDTSVVILVVSDRPEEVSTSPSLLTFDPASWSEPQFVVFTATNDIESDGDQTVSVTVTVADSLSDSLYHPVPDRLVTVQSLDDDIGSFSIQSTGGSTAVTESGDLDQVSVVLDARPLSDVVLRAESRDSSEVTVSPGEITFTPGDWSVPQFLTVQGVDDPVLDGTQVTTLLLVVDSTASDPAFIAAGLDSVLVATGDNDRASFFLLQTPPPGPLVDSTQVSENGAQDSVVVVLGAQPRDPVVLLPSTAQPGVFRSLTPSLTFDSTNWSVPQVFVLTGEDDDLIDGAQQATLIVSVDAATSDDDFDTVAPASVLVTTSDDDVAAIVILESAGGTVVSEDGTGVDAFLVSLSALPRTNVVLNVSSSDLGEVAVAPNQLTFTPSDWDSAQPISVNGVDDLFDDGDLDVPVVLTIDPDASDDDFDSAPSDTVIVENLDDDTAGLTVTQSENLSVVGEAGLQDTLTVLLEAKPIDPVTVTILSSDTLEVRVSPSLLTYTTANWNVAQTVVISGQDDTTADGNKPALIAIGVSEGLSDPSFANVSDETVLVTNLDNDRVSVSVTPTGGLRTTEAGSTQTFDVVLNAQPSADVIIPLVSGDPTEGEVDQSSLTFTPSDWNTPQTVTVTGQ